jgi:hypothetical protein
MRAMRHRKGIIDENVAECRELRNEIRIVLFLAHMKPSVFQAYDVARVHSGDRCGCFFPYAVLSEGNRPLQDVGNRRGQQLE